MDLIKLLDVSSPKNIKNVINTLIREYKNVVENSPTKLSDLTDDETHRLVTDNEKASWNAKLGPSALDSVFLKDNANKAFVSNTGLSYDASKDSYGLVTEYKNLLTDKTTTVSSMPIGHASSTRSGLLTPAKLAEIEANTKAIQNIPTKVSAFENDSKYATEDYVNLNGGKIDVIKVNNVPQEIVNKTIELTIPSIEGLASETLVNTKTQEVLTTANKHTDDRVSGLIGQAPETLDTLKEIADALAEDQTTLDTLNLAIGNKVNKTLKINGKTLEQDINLTAADIGVVVPTNNNQLTNGAGYITATRPAGQGVGFISKDNAGFTIYGDSISENLYTYIINSEGKSGWYKLLDTNGKLYSGHKEVAVKEEVPSVNNPTITIKQGEETKGTFTLNQSNDSTIELDVGGESNVILYSDLGQNTDGAMTQKAITEAIDNLVVLDAIQQNNKMLYRLTQTNKEVKAGTELVVKFNAASYDGASYLEIVNDAGTGQYSLWKQSYFGSFSNNNIAYMQYLEWEANDIIRFRYIEGFKTNTGTTSSGFIAIENITKNYYYGTSQSSVADANKANKDATNLTEANITNWQEKLKISSLPLGMILPSAVTQSNAGLHLLDGGELAIGGSYDAFCQFIINKYNTDNTSVPVTDLVTYQTELDTYGQCGKFVITDTYIKLPKITKFIEGLSSISDLGTSFAAGLPEHTHTGSYRFRDAGKSGGPYNGTGSGSYFNWTTQTLTTDTISDGKGIYGNSDTVQPQSTKYPYYIVVGTVTKTDIEVNIDNVATDLNNKADKTGANIDKDAFKVALNLEPTLLWENPTPTSAQAVQTITVDDLTQYKYLLVYFKNYITNTGLNINISKIPTTFPSDAHCCVVADNSGAVSSRAFNLTNKNSIYIYAGRKGTTSNTSQCPIIAFYGLK